MTKQNCLQLTHKEGISFGISSDSGQAGKYGDEAENVISVGYDLGGGAAFSESKRSGRS